MVGLLDETDYHMRIILTNLFLIVACAKPAPAPNGASVDREVLAMGSTLAMQIAAEDRAAALSASEAAVQAIEAADFLLSTWREDSRLAVLNTAAVGETLGLDPELCRVLSEVESLATATGRAFEPVIGALEDAWDLRGDGQIPTAAELLHARRITGAGGIEFSLANCAARRLDPAAWVESGGFGKGYALRAARDSLRAHGVHSARLNFGGQVVTLGEASESAAWRVPVANPLRRGDPAFTLWLRDASASTSSQSERFVRAAGQRLGHILDPRTGTPIPNWGSVTVVDADPVRADVLSTALLVLGPRAALSWAADHPETGVLVIQVLDSTLDARANAGLDPYLVPPSSTSSN